MGDVSQEESTCPGDAAVYLRRVCGLSLVFPPSSTPSVVAVLFIGCFAVVKGLHHLLVALESLVCRRHPRPSALHSIDGLGGVTEVVLPLTRPLVNVLLPVPEGSRPGDVLISGDHVGVADQSHVSVQGKGCRFVVVCVS